jgi:hypothetical protein
MKKYYVTVLTVLTIGVLMILVGWMNGGSQMKTWDWDFLGAIESSKSQKGQHYHLQGRFNKINIDVDDADVKIQTGAKFSAEIITTDKETTLQSHIQNQTLNIAQSESHKKLLTNFNLGWAKTNQPQINITVPNKSALNQIVFDSTDTHVQLKDLIIDTIALDNEDTTLTMANVTVKQKMVANDGDVKGQINNCRFNHLKVDCGDTNLKINKSHINSFISDTGDAKFYIDNSVIANWKLDSEDLDMLLTNSTLQHNNSIDAEDVNLKIRNINRDLSYHLSGDDSNIHYYNQHSDGTFVKNNSKKNRLAVNGEDLDVSIK